MSEFCLTSLTKMKETLKGLSADYEKMKTAGTSSLNSLEEKMRNELQVLQVLTERAGRDLAANMRKAKGEAGKKAVFDAKEYINGILKHKGVEETEVWKTEEQPIEKSEKKSTASAEKSSAKPQSKESTSTS